jgi:AraC-like DNA-binding protein
MKPLLTAILLVLNYYAISQNPLIDTPKIIDSIKQVPSGLIAEYYSKLDTSSADFTMRTDAFALKSLDNKAYFKHGLARIIYYINRDEKKAAKTINELQAHSIAREQNDLSAQFYTLKGIFYYNLDRIDDAELAYQKALILYKSMNDSSMIKGSLINMGNCFFKRENPDSALFYFHQAKQLSSAGVLAFEDNLTNNLAAVYMQLERYQEAGSIYKKLIIEYDSLKQNSVRSLRTIYANLSVVYTNTYRLDSALIMLTKALEKEPGELTDFSDGDLRYRRAHVYAELGEMSAAFKDLSISDSLRILDDKVGSNRTIDELKLKHSQRLATEKNKQAKAELAYERNVRQIVILFTIILAIALIFILRLLYKSHQKNWILAKKNIELTRKNKQTKHSKKQARDISPDLIEEIEHALIDNKLYLKQDLTLEKLAQKLKTNRTYLSEHINQHFGVSFSILLNKLRIQAARELLIDEGHKHFSIEGISQSVGYRSLSLFNSKFKKETGITPSYFRKTHLKSSKI